MRQLFQHIRQFLAEFETWFEQRFGWFFTNGMKQDQVTGAEPDNPSPVVPKA